MIKTPPSLLMLVLVASLLSGCIGESSETLLASAKSMIEKKDGKAAVIQLKNALQKDPSLSEARFLLGKLLLESGDVVGATVELGKAKDAGFAKEQVDPVLARAMLLQGQYDKLLTTFGSSKLDAPRAQAELLASVASAYAAKGKDADADAAVAAALQLDANNLDAGLLQVGRQAARGDMSAAMSSVDLLLKTYPEQSQVWFAKGQLLQLSPDPAARQGAIDAFKQAVEKNASNTGAHSALMLIYMRGQNLEAASAQLDALKAVAPTHPQTQFLAALLAREKGDLRLAFEKIQGLLKIAPDDLKVLQLAGAIELQRNSLLQAETHLAKVVSAAPQLAQARLLLAQAYLRSGTSSKALSTLQPMLRAKPPIAAAFALAGEVYMQQGDVAEAEASFAKAIALNPKDSRSRTGLAMTLLQQGKEEQALLDLKSIASTDSSTTADMALISSHMRKRDWKAALGAIDVLEKKSPSRPIAAHLRAQVELSQGDRDAARKSFSAALKLDPEYYPAVAGLAGMDVADKNPKEAIRRFEEFLKQAPQNLNAKLALLALRAEGGLPITEIAAALGKIVADHPSDIEPRLALLRLHVSKQEPKLALSVAQDAVSVLPESGELLDAYAQVQVLNGQTNQATGTLKKWAAMQADSPRPWLRLAEIQLGMKDLEGAEQSYKRALGLKADILAAQQNLILVYAQQKRLTEARSVIKQVRSQRRDAAAELLEGDLEIMQKNYPAALQAYQAGLAKQANNELAIKIYKTLYLADKKDEAAKWEVQWQQKYPKSVALTFFVADAALQQNNYVLAEQKFQDVLKVTPNDSVSLNNLAWLLNRAKKPGALQLAERAVQEEPKQPAFLDTLAEIHATEGRLDKAIELQRQALKFAPNAHPNRFALAKYYAQAGKKSEAKETLKPLIEMGEKFTQYKELQEFLKSI